MVALVQELRRKAALCRRAASISTSGSGRTDRILLALAEQLEREVALRERQLHDGTLPEIMSGRGAAFVPAIGWRRCAISRSLAPSFFTVVTVVAVVD